MGLWDTLKYLVVTRPDKPKPKPAPRPYVPPATGHNYKFVQDSIRPKSPALPTPPPRPEDNLTGLFNELMSSMGQQYMMPSDAALRNQAQSTVNAQFDPQITALQQAMNTAKGNATRSKAGIRDIYSALSKDYAKEVPKSKAQHAQAKKEAATRTSDLKSTLSKDYSTRLAEQQKMMQELGIEAAAPDVLTDQNADLAYFQNMASTEGNQEQTYLSGLDQSMSNYLSTGQQSATLEGSNRQADLEQELQNYLRENTSQMTGLQAQKKQSFSAVLSQLQGDLQKQAAEMQQQNWTNALNLGRFKLDVEKANQDKAAKPYSRGLLGAGQIFGDSVSPQRGQDLMGVLQGVLGSQQVREGKFDTGRKDRYGQPEFTGMTPEQAASLIREEAKRRGITNPVEQLALTNAMLAYFGRLGG